MKRILLLTCMALLLLTSFTVPTSAEDEYYHGELEQKMVWTPASGGGKYTRHRIPGVVVSQKGTVLIYCEARNGNVTGTQGLGGDWCLMDIYVQRSEDGGKTFGDPIYIAKGDVNTYATVNNPVMIVGNDNVLHILFCKDYSVLGGGMWYARSTDDGKTWTEPRKLTNYSDTIEHDVLAFGPTHGICTENGTLMVPVWYVPKGAGETITTHGPKKTTLMYSTDYGETWQLSDQILGMGAEYSIAQLSDGSIMLNGRASPYRYVAVAQEELGKYTYKANDGALVDPSCCGGLAAVNVPGLPRALLYGGCASKSYRENVTLYCSFDDGLSWQKSIALSGKGVGGYVDVNVDNRTGKIYVLYEVSNESAICLATLSFADTFCVGSASPIRRNEIVFDTEVSLDAVNATKSRNIDYTFTGTSMLLKTERSTAAKKIQLDMEYISRNVDMKTHPYMLARIRVNEASEEDAVLRAYFLSGREVNATESNGVAVSVAKDGQWYSVVFDTSMLSIRGSLHTVELRLEGKNDAKNAMINVELGALAFCKSAEEAQNYVFAETEKNVGDDNGNAGEETWKDERKADIQTETDAEQAQGNSEKGGCGSTLFHAFLPILTVLSAVAYSSSNKKNKKY